MFLVKDDDIDELMQVSRQISIFSYLQSLVYYDIDNHIVNINGYNISREDALSFIADNQKNCAAELRHILCHDDFLQQFDK